MKVPLTVMGAGAEPSTTDAGEKELTVGVRFSTSKMTPFE